MRSLLAVLVLVAGVFSAAAKEDKKPDAKGDLEKMQGTWTFEKFIRDGEALPEDRRKSLVLVVKDKEFSLKAGERGEKMSITLDPTKTPPTLDSSEDGRVVFYGIYRLEKDTLTIVFAPDERPTSFEVPKAKRVAMWVLKRKAK